MKKISFYELFLYLLAVICFITFLISVSGVLNSISNILFQEPAIEGSLYNSVLYAKRGLVTSIPMIAVSSGLFVFIWKEIKKERKYFLESEKKINS